MEKVEVITGNRNFRNKAYSDVRSFNSNTVRKSPLVVSIPKGIGSPGCHLLRLKRRYPTTMKFDQVLVSLWAQLLRSLRIYLLFMINFNWKCLQIFF